MCVSPKCIWKNKGTRIARTTSGENKLEDSQYFKIDSKPTEIKTVSYWQKGKQILIEEWKRIKTLEIDPYIYDQLSCEKKVQRQFNGEKIVFLTNGTQFFGYPNVKTKTKTKSFQFLPYTICKN